MKTLVMAACVLGGAAMCTTEATAQPQTLKYILNSLSYEVNPPTGACNFLYNNGPTQNFCPNEIYWYDQRGSTNDTARPLLYFTLPALPPCSTITNVSLQLFVQQYTFIDVNNGGVTVPWPISVYAMKTPWDPCTSNWTQSSATTNWSTPGLAAGVDYNATAAAVTTVGGFNKRFSWDITALYQQWAAGTVPNYGLHIRGVPGVPNSSTSDGDTTDGVMQILAPSYDDDNFRPWVVITYTVATGTCGGCCFADGSCQVTGSDACAAANGTAQASGSSCTPNTCPVASGTCCKGSTCVTGVAAAACTGANTAYTAGGTTCNASGNRKSPCCEADFNHSGSITVQDIFDFLAAWFAHSPIANITSNGAGAPTVQSIFDFLAAWFAKGC